MKLIIWVLSMAITLPVAAQGPAKTPLKSPVRGYLVDMLCARQRKAEGVTFGQTHTKMCLQMPPCVKSGYAVMTPDNQILKFDEIGTAKAIKLVGKSKQEKGFVVKVAGKISGDEIKVSKIELLPPDSLAK